MSSQGWAISIHVVSALLGLGQVAAVVVAASTLDATDPRGWLLLRRLLLGVRASLGVLLLSGVFIEYSLGGPYHGYGWFRLSVLGWLLLGVLGLLATRALGKQAPLGNEAARRAVVRLAASMCAIAAAVVVLMELKPF